MGVNFCTKQASIYKNRQSSEPARNDLEKLTSETTLEDNVVARSTLVERECGKLEERLHETTGIGEQGSSIADDIGGIPFCRNHASSPVCELNSKPPHHGVEMTSGTVEQQDVGIRAEVEACCGHHLDLGERARSTIESRVLGESDLGKNALK